jgi:hypothetical protein
VAELYSVNKPSPDAAVAAEWNAHLDREINYEEFTEMLVRCALLQSSFRNARRIKRKILYQQRLELAQANNQANNVIQDGVSGTNQTAEGALGHVGQENINSNIDHQSRNINDNNNNNNNINGSIASGGFTALDKRIGNASRRSNGNGSAMDEKDKAALKKSAASQGQGLLLPAINNNANNNNNISKVGDSNQTSRLSNRPPSTSKLDNNINSNIGNNNANAAKKKQQYGVWDLSGNVVQMPGLAHFLIQLKQQVFEFEDNSPEGIQQQQLQDQELMQVCDQFVRTVIGLPNLLTEHEEAERRQEVQLKEMEVEFVRQAEQKFLIEEAKNKARNEEMDSAAFASTLDSSDSRSNIGAGAPGKDGKQSVNASAKPATRGKK